VFEPNGLGLEPGRDESRIDELDDGLESLRLGHDVRFVLVVVGGGAVRVGREIARRHIRHLETVAVNCDPRVQELDEFDRRVFLGTPSDEATGTGGSPAVGGRLARAAEPALDRIFAGVTFVVVVASLGGGSGTGALPHVLEAASRSSEFVSLFAIKPFECEGDRRAVADRALARLHFLEGFVEKQETRRATVTVLDNEGLARRQRTLPFAQVVAHWADLIARHIEHAYLTPIEAALEARRVGRMVDAEPMRLRAAASPSPGPMPPLDPPIAPIPLAPQMPLGGDAELTFEVLGPTAPGRTL
jgi:Tubulin/FtsZ family, GTPase domain